MEFVIRTPDTITLDKPISVFRSSKSDCDEVFLMYMLLQMNLLIVSVLHSSHLYLLVQAHLIISCCRISMRRMNVPPKMTNRPKACQHTMNGRPFRTLRHLSKMWSGVKYLRVHLMNVHWASGDLAGTANGCFLLPRNLLQKIQSQRNQCMNEECSEIEPKMWLWAAPRPAGFWHNN